MININGDLCWSPLPPEAYGESPIGHGPMCNGDIQMWNLMYLSYPQVDGYLTAGDKLAFYQSHPISTIANVRSSLNGSESQRLFPGLRDALRRAPHLFLEDLWRMQWELIPMYLDDKSWTDIIQVRAKEIDTNTNLERVAAVTHREGNVINVKFGRK